MGGWWEVDGFWFCWVAKASLYDDWADRILDVAEDVPLHGENLVLDGALQSDLYVLLSSMDIHVHPIMCRCGMGEDMWEEGGRGTGKGRVSVGGAGGSG